MKQKNGGTIMSENWDNTEMRNERVIAPTGASTYIIVNGESFRLDAGASFTDTVQRFSRDAGYGKFRVFMNGNEIRPSQAPDTISEGDKLELRPFDIAG
jgi:hypothetical protein